MICSDQFINNIFLFISMTYMFDKFEL